MPDAMCLFHGSAFQIYTKFVQDSDFQYLQNNIDEVCIGIGEDEDMRIVGTKKFQYFQSRWYLSNNYINWMIIMWRYDTYQRNALKHLIDLLQGHTLILQLAKALVSDVFPPLVRLQNKA